jgi:superfamily I DNA/RNA helicase
VKLCRVDDPPDEQLMVRDLVRRFHDAGSLAILARNNSQIRTLSAALQGIDGPAGIAMMTMHASKGLEFDTVIVAGVADLVIPDRTSDIEEERRLLYVALTRARERLFVILHYNPDGSPPGFGRELGATDRE